MQKQVTVYELKVKREKRKVSLSTFHLLTASPSQSHTTMRPTGIKNLPLLGCRFLCYLLIVAKKQLYFTIFLPQK